MEIGQSAGKSFAYLLGVYLGDGCVTNVQGYDRFRLNTIDEDFAKATAEAIADLSDYRVAINGPYQDKRFPKSAPQYMLHCGDTGLCARLKAETNAKQNIPAWVFEASRDDRLAFIAGMMDSEGFVAENRSRETNRRYFMGFKACELWVHDFARLLEQTGIRTTGVKVEQPRKPGYKVPLKLHIKMQSWIDAGAYFKCARKQRRVAAWAEFGPYEQRSRYPRVAKAIPNEHMQGAPA